MSKLSIKKSRVRVVAKSGGARVEVECDLDQVGAVVQQLMSALPAGPDLRSMSILMPAPTGPVAQTCRGVVEDMLGDGFFAERRSLADVCDEAARRGYHYSRTAVAHVLLDMVKEGILAREGKPRRYRYVTKRPIAVG